MSGRDGKVCAVFYCHNYQWQRESCSFFRFPKDSSICAEWVKRCGRADLDEIFEKYGSERLHNSYRICSKHFQTTDLRNQNLSSQGLKKNTVPSLFLTKGSYVKSNGEKKRKRENSSDSKHSSEEGRVSAVSQDSVPETTAEVIIKEEPFCLEEYAEVKLEEGASIFQCEIKNNNEDIWTNPSDKFPLKIGSEVQDCVLNWVGSIRNERSSLLTDEKDKNSKFIESAGSYPEEIQNHKIRVSNFIFSASLEGDGFITVKADRCGRVKTNMHEVQGGNVASHKEDHTQSLNTKTYKNSEICDKNIYPLSNTKKNYLINGGKGPYKCKICRKTFIRAGNLKIHTAAVHEGKKQFRCKVSGKTFPLLSHLKQHFSIHEDNTAYKCKLCEKSFRCLSDLRQHRSIHRGKIPPHKCSICKKTFTSVVHLKNHNLIHNGKKPYK